MFEKHADGVFAEQGMPERPDHDHVAAEAVREGRGRVLAVSAEPQ